MKPNPLNFTIKDGTLYATGLYQLHTQEGITLPYSLGIMLELAKSTGDTFAVDWADFYRSAKIDGDRQRGWTFDRVRKMVEEGLADSGWPETFLDTVRAAMASHFD